MEYRTSSLAGLAALLIASVFFSTSALASPHDHGKRGHRDYRPSHHRVAPAPHRAQPPRHRAAPPRQVQYRHAPPPAARVSYRHERPWRVGRILPRTVTYYDVPSPHHYRLPTAPRGHRYVRVGHDIVLLAIGTGLIVNAMYDIIH